MTATTFDTMGTARSTQRSPKGEPVSAKSRQGYVPVPFQATMHEALDAVRRSKAPLGQSGVVFLLDDEGRYRGFVRLSALVRAEPTARLDRNG
jgi:Mg/Co/Ni transporter MgtE